MSPQPSKEAESTTIISYSMPKVLSIIDAMQFLEIVLGVPVNDNDRKVDRCHECCLKSNAMMLSIYAGPQQKAPNLLLSQVANSLVIRHPRYPLTITGPKARQQAY